jgi:hypothetical protein
MSETEHRDLDPEEMRRFVEGDLDEQIAPARAEVIGSYRRLTAALPAAGANLVPPAGWEARVFAAIAAPPVPWWRRRLAWLLGPGLVLAMATALLLVWLRAPSPTPGPLALAIAIESGGTRRTDSAAVGDLLIAHGSGGAGHTAIWIYRDDRTLILACPGVDGCVGQQGELRASLRIDRPGRYQVVLLSAETSLPLPRGSLDTDLAAAERVSGAEHRIATMQVW